MGASRQETISFTGSSRALPKDWNWTREAPEELSPASSPLEAPAHWARLGLFSRRWFCSGRAYAHALTEPLGRSHVAAGKRGSSLQSLPTPSSPLGLERKQRRSFRFRQLFLFQFSRTQCRQGLRLQPWCGRRQHHGDVRADESERGQVAQGDRQV